MKQRSLRIQDVAFGEYNLTTIFNNTMYQVAVITEEAYHKFEVSSNEVVKFDRAGILKKYIRMSADALESSVLSALKPSKEHVSGSQALELLNDLNLKLINFLATLSLTLDHTKTRLTRTYGADSEILKQFVSTDSAEYDAHFNYRFLKRLRNSVVHCEQPISHYNLQSKLDNPPYGKSATYQLEIGFDREALIKDFDGWSTVKQEIMSETAYIPLSGITNSAVESIDRILDTVRKLELPRIHEYAQFIMDFIEPALFMNSLVGIAMFTDHGSGNVTTTHKDAPLLILEELGYDIRGSREDTIVDGRLRDRPPGPRF